ncbi:MULTISPECIES: SEC-C metal-binding domain-containing protein [Pseudidiomarina]
MLNARFNSTPYRHELCPCGSSKKFKQCCWH